MTLRVKLTLGSVALATVLVAIISAVSLINQMQFLFENTLRRAEVIKQDATDAVIDGLNRQPTVHLEQAVRDNALTERLKKLLGLDPVVLDIMLVQADTNLVLASTLGRAQPGTAAYPEPYDFAPLVRKGWLQQVRALHLPGLQWLLPGETQSYKLDQGVGPGGTTLINVRVLVDISLIKGALEKPFN